MPTQLQKISEHVSFEDNELYDKKHSVSNKLRNEMLLNFDNLPKPIEGSTAELIYLNQIDELKKRLDSKANPNERDELGPTVSWTLLYWSVKLGNIPCTKMLLSYGADINLVVNDCDECCGTVLDLVTLRSDTEMENTLREFAEETNIGLGQSFKAIRTRLRGKAPACSFKYYGKKKE